MLVEVGIRLFHLGDTFILYCFVLRLSLSLVEGGVDRFIESTTDGVASTLDAFESGLNITKSAMCLLLGLVCHVLSCACDELDASKKLISLE